MRDLSRSAKPDCLEKFNKGVPAGLHIKYIRMLTDLWALIVAGGDKLFSLNFWGLFLISIFFGRRP